MTEIQTQALRAYLSTRSERVKHLENAPLSRMTTLRIGGSADHLLTPLDREALCDLLSFLSQTGIRHQILGRGSNLLFEDGGYRGVIVYTGGLDGIAVEGDRVRAQAGVSVTALSVAARRAGLSGMEFYYGIPGSVGGAVYMNAGAYDGETAGILRSVVCYDRKEDTLVTLTCEQCEMDYRHSIFFEGRYVILEAEYQLTPGDEDAIKAQMEDLMKRRADKQPLQYASAGSTFKRYPGTFTAKLIDEAGLKGTRIGDAQVSEKHAGFLINLGEATCADFRALIDLVRDRVEQVHGVRIEREVEYLPEDEGEGVEAWS